MSSYIKYRICQVAAIICIGGILFCGQKMTEAALSGQPGARWFTIVVGLLIIGLPAAVAMYYFRAKSTDDDMEKVSTETLAATAQPDDPDTSAKRTSQR